MTIDPARRLAESLGLERMSTEAVTIDAAKFRDAGVPMSGSLTVTPLLAICVTTLGLAVVALVV